MGWCASHPAMVLSVLGIHDMKKSQLVAPVAAFALIVASTGAFVAAAHADTSASSAATTLSATGTQTGIQNSGQRQRPVAVGTVTVVSGNSITLTDKMSGTTYTVDATNATIQKMGTPSTSTAGAATTPPTPTPISVSDIAVGDTLMIQGTVSGSTISATHIMDGQPPMGHGGPGGHGLNGTVTGVNGSTITITGSDGTTYTVNATNATASKVVTLPVSSIAVGDSINVNGSVSGTSVTAEHIMDGVPAGDQDDASSTYSGS